MLDDYRLLEIEVEASNPVDEHGHFKSDRSPRLFLGQTRDGNVRRFRYDLPLQVIKDLEDVIDEEPIVTDLSRGLTLFEEYKRILGKHEPVQQVTMGLGYRYPEKLQRFPDVVRVNQDNVHLARTSFPWLLEEFKECQPCVAVVEDSRLVSQCHSPYISQEAHVAGVETLEGYRRRGYATAVAVEWGAAVMELGQIPIYSTGLDNVASQGVARRAGLILYNADHHFR